LLDLIVDALPPEQEGSGDEEEEEVTRIAIVGRPNVGKSSLLNAILGIQRSNVSDVPGTTRDAIDIEFEYKDKKTHTDRYCWYTTQGTCRPWCREI